MANKRLNATITIGGAITGALKNALGTTRQQLQGIGVSIRELTTRQQRLQTVSTHWEKMGRDASRFHTELKRVNAELDRQRKMQSVIRAQDANTAKRGELRGQLFDAVGLGMTLAAPIAQTIKLESALADVRKVVDFDTPEQFKQMEADIVGMTRRLPMAADQISAIVAAGGQAGIARQDLLAFAEDAVKMGVAFDITADQAGQMMAEFRTSFKLSQPEVVALADKINLLGNTTAASAPRISELVRRVGPLGEVAGLASGEIAALGATLISMGVQEEVAATGVQNLLLGLVAGESATKAQKEAFDSLGMSAADVAARMQTDAKGAILDVLESVKKLPPEIQAATLQKLFGKESINAIAPLLNSTDKLAENLAKVADATQYAGSMNKEYEARAATTANNLQLFQNRISALGIAVGNVLLPALNSMLGVVGPVFDTVADLANEFPLLTTVVVGGTAALIGIKVAAIAGGYAFTFLKGAWLTTTLMGLKLGAALPAIAGGIKAIGLALAANPIGLVLTGIALAAGLVIANWEPVKGFMINLWGSITTGAMDAWEWLKGVFTGLFDNIRETVTAAIDWVLGKINAVGNAWGSVKSFFGFGDKNQQAAPGAPGAAGNTAPLPAPSMATAPGAAGSVNAPQTNTFNITQLPGQDSKALADEVMRRMAEKQSVQRRGLMFDPAMGY